MTALPAELAFGFVYFRAILAVADTSDDVDRDPDAVGASGSVTFTSKVPIVKTLLPEPVTIAKQVIECPLDSAGYLLERAGGQRGVWLVTGQYLVTYNIDNMTLPSHDISVESTHNQAAPLNLTTTIPPPTEPTLSQYQVLNGRLLVLESRPVITASPASEPPLDPVLNQIWVKY